VFEPRDKTPAEQVARRARRHVKTLKQLNQEDSGLDGAGVEPRSVNKVGILGAGLMGCGMAAAFVRADREVWIADTDPAALAAAPERHPAETAQAGACDLVVESIVERFSAKQELLRTVEQHMRPDALLASNTSTIPIGRLGAGLHRPERFCGLHFCHPVRTRPLVEIVRASATSDQTVATAVACVKSINKMPIVVSDGPGFLVNRLLLPYIGEALELLVEGVAAEAVEQTARDFGMAKGPLRLLDEIGLDTTLQGAWVLAEAYPERVVSSPVLVSMVKAGRLGCKSGAGFFCYADRHGPDARDVEHGSQLPEVAPAARQIIGQWAGPERHCTAHEIGARLLLPMLLEATRVLEEHKVRHARDIDLAAIFGLGFPDWRGGLLWWADGMGVERVVEALRPLATRLGRRAEPTALLREMARRGGRFYDLEPSH